MTDKEKKDFSKTIDEYMTDVLKSKSSSEKFLKDIGVITKGGKVSKNYKNLCIPQNRD